MVVGVVSEGCGYKVMVVAVGCRLWQWILVVYREVVGVVVVVVVMCCKV